MIISIDRFFEMYKAELPGISTFDLMLLGTGTYLIDFFGFSLDDLFTVTLDNDFV